MVAFPYIFSALTLAAVGVAAVLKEDDGVQLRRQAIRELKKTTKIDTRNVQVFTPTSAPTYRVTTQPLPVATAADTSVVDPNALDSYPMELKITNIDVCSVDGYTAPYTNLEMVLLRMESMDTCSTVLPATVHNDKIVTVTDCSTAMTRRRDAMTEDGCLYGACQPVTWSWVTYTVTCLNGASNCTPGVLRSNTCRSTVDWKDLLLQTGMFYDAGTPTNPSSVEVVNSYT